MIELVQSKDPAIIYTWCYEVVDKLKSARYQNDDITLQKLGSMFDRHLHLDSFDDDLSVGFEDGKLVFDLTESSHETTDMRQENIAFIRMFVANEMPYLEFEDLTEYYYDGWGFILTYRIKENTHEKP